MPSPFVRSRFLLHGTSDASGKSNNVALSICGLRIFIEVDAGSDLDIVILEFLAVLFAVLYLGPFLPGAIFRFGLDNATCSSWGNKGRAKRGDALDMLKLVFFAMHQHGQTALFRWLSRYLNHANDRTAAATSATQATRETGATHTFRLRGAPPAFLARLIAEARIASSLPFTCAPAAEWSNGRSARRRF